MSVSYTHLDVYKRQVLGVALTNVQNGYGFVQSVVNGIGTAVGYTISIVLLAGIREHMEGNDVPYSFQGSPIVLVTAGLMAIAFLDVYKRQGRSRAVQKALHRHERDGSGGGFVLSGNCF